VGRRPTNITYPEKATHNSNSKDNLIDTGWRDFLNSTVETCNHYGNLKLKNTNFKKQFGSSNIQNQKFINIKLYQYLTYNPPINDKYKSHKFFGSHNEKIIKKVLVGNNEKLKCLLKSKIQDIYNIYIRKGNEKVIIDDIELDYFKKLTDVINEKNKKIKDLSSLKKDNNSSISIFKIRGNMGFTDNQLKEENNYIYDSKYNLDIYSFENAILYDKRKFFRLYYICLLSQERFLNTFCLKSPLEIKSLRISLFIFNYSCDFALNSIFYSNEKISDKYHYNGNKLRLFVLVNNITISLFSTIVSIIIIKFLNILTQSKRGINKIFNEIKNKSNQKELKYINKNNIFIERLYKICHILKFKIACYIILEFSLLLFFFYYVTVFCIVYQKTQIDWLYDSIISIFLSIYLIIHILYPFPYNYSNFYNFVIYFILLTILHQISLFFLIYFHIFPKLILL
jgi:hypothetical protein